MQTLPSDDVPQVGFTPGGKVWVLDGLLDATWTGDFGVGPYVLYEEP